MHIALISYEFPPDTGFGGIATYIFQVANMLGSAGHSVEVFTASEKRNGSENAGSYLVHFAYLASRSNFYEAVVPIFAARHAVQPFDVLESPEIGADGRDVIKHFPNVAHVVKMHTPSELVREINSCKLQFSGQVRRKIISTRIAVGAIRRGRLPSKTPNQNIEQIEREYARCVDFVVSPSQSMLEWTIKCWDIARENIMQVPNPYIPSADLLKIGMRDAGKVIGFFGRLEQRKGITTLVDALPRILEAEPDASVRIIGRTMEYPATLEPFDRYIRRKLRPYLHRVKLTGGCSLEQIPDEYRQVDICAYPSIWENFPNVCLEAMAAGRAVVGSSAGGMAEMLADGAGILVDPRSPQQLADAVIRFLRSPELRKSCGEKARHVVMSRYSAAVVLPQVIASYERAIELNHAKR